MHDTTLSEKSTGKRRFKGWTAEQMALAVSNCPPELLRTENAGGEAAFLPPLCNTGVETNLERPGPSLLVDYLRFTVKPPTQEKEADALQFWLYNLGGSPDNWTVSETGLYGYHQTYHCGNIRIFAGGQPGMGICCQLSGLGCREFESLLGRGESVKYIKCWSRFFKWLRPYTYHGPISITRLDVAIDDKSGSLDIQTVKQAALDGNYSCRSGVALRSSVDESKKRGAPSFGVTVYFGKRTSSAMMRFYDKAAQTGTLDPWIRAEYEAHDEKAMLLAELIADEGGDCIPGVLRGFIDFKQPGHGYAAKNRYKAPSVAWWLSFCRSLESIVLSVDPVLPSIEKIRKWIGNQVVCNMAVLFDSVSDPVSLLGTLLQEGRERWKPKHQALLNSEMRRLRLLAEGPTGF